MRKKIIDPDLDIPLEKENDETDLDDLDDWDEEV